MAVPVLLGHYTSVMQQWLPVWCPDAASVRMCPKCDAI